MSCDIVDRTGIAPHLNRNYTRVADLDAAFAQQSRNVRLVCHQHNATLRIAVLNPH